jgi:hypothetical protein
LPVLLKYILLFIFNNKMRLNIHINKILIFSSHPTHSDLLSLSLLSHTQDAFEERDYAFFSYPLS